MANALDDVKQTYISLAGKYLALRAACVDDGQRALLDAQYVKAQGAYYTCADNILSDDDKDVAILSGELKDANTAVDDAVKEMGNMSKVIDGITQAVTTGAKLITAAGL